MPNRFGQTCGRERGPERLAHGGQVRGHRVPACRRSGPVRVCHPFEVGSTSVDFMKWYADCCARGSLIDYIAVSGSMERNVLEFVDHLHEHFLYPCSINKNGRYNVPSNPAEGYRCVVAVARAWVEVTDPHDSIEMHQSSIAEYEWPHGSYWVNSPKKAQ